MSKVVKLDSGRELEITLAPYEESLNLFQGIMEEVKQLKLDPNADFDINFLKDLFCAFVSSKKVQSLLAPCMKRVIYNGGPIDKNTFESVEAREDYVPICFEVTKENVLPFTKSLYVQYGGLVEKLRTALT